MPGALRAGGVVRARGATGLDAQQQMGPGPHLPTRQNLEDNVLKCPGPHLRTRQNFEDNVLKERAPALIMRYTPTLDRNGAQPL